MHFEGADGSLRGVAPVHVWQDNLVCAAPCVGDVAMVVCTGLIVEDDSVDIELPGTEVCQDGVGSCLAANGWTSIALLE